MKRCQRTSHEIRECRECFTERIAPARSFPVIHISKFLLKRPGSSFSKLGMKRCSDSFQRSERCVMGTVNLKKKKYYYRKNKSIIGVLLMCLDDENAVNVQTISMN